MNEYVTWTDGIGWSGKLRCRCGNPVPGSVSPDLWESDDYRKKLTGYMGSLIPWIPCTGNDEYIPGGCNEIIFGVYDHGTCVFVDGASLLRVSSPSDRGDDRFDIEDNDPSCYPVFRDVDVITSTSLRCKSPNPVCLTFTAPDMNTVVLYLYKQLPPGVDPLLRTVQERMVHSVSDGRDCLSLPGFMTYKFVSG